MARSPNRDRVDRFAGNRQYFQHRTAIERWKGLLCWVALLGGLGWAAATFLTDRIHYQLSHGPLTAAHAPWDARCEACHRADAERAHWLDARSRWRSFTCEKCHAAPRHHANIPDGDASEDCTTCHQDHQGRDHSLVRLADAHCVRCHGNLAAYSLGPVRFANVSNFATHHPDFRVPENPTRYLQFSHSQHLTPGMVLAEGAKNAWRLSDVPEDRRHEFQNQVLPGTDIILLNCSACHTLETNSPTRAEGRYFQPISYERHCAACHPTQTQPQVTARKQVVPALEVPHGLPTEAVRTFLTQAYSLALQQEHPELLKQPKVRDLRRQQPASGRTVADKTFIEDVAATAAAAHTMLLNVVCAKCHVLEGGEVKPTAIPTIWMHHARFDHTAHRALDCVQCHPAAMSRVENGLTIVTARDHEPPNLPTLESCRQCHSPNGGVRHACTDCHNYHHGDHPLHGRGAPAFSPPKKITIEEFLRGH